MRTYMAESGRPLGRTKGERSATSAAGRHGASIGAQLLSSDATRSPLKPRFPEPPAVPKNAHVALKTLGAKASQPAASPTAPKAAAAARTAPSPADWRIGATLEAVPTTIEKPSITPQSEHIRAACLAPLRRHCLLAWNSECWEQQVSPPMSCSPNSPSCADAAAAQPSTEQEPACWLSVDMELTAEEAIAIVSPTPAEADAFAPPNAVATQSAATDTLRAIAAAAANATSRCRRAAVKAARRLASTKHLRRGPRLSPAYLLCPDADITAAEALWLVNPDADLPVSPLPSATHAQDATSAPAVPAPAAPITPEQPALVPLAPASTAAPAAQSSSPIRWAQAAKRMAAAAARGALSLRCLAPRIR